MKAGHMSPIRVLIVDDIADVRHELRLVLTLSGDIVVVGEASDGWEAVRQTGALYPEVVLMDLEMPGMDGWTAARRIKTLLPGCRVIPLTIHDSDEDRRRCREAGMEGFLVKGARVEALLQAIRRSGEPQEGVAR